MPNLFDWPPIAGLGRGKSLPAPVEHRKRVPAVILEYGSILEVRNPPEFGAGNGILELEFDSSGRLTHRRTYTADSVNRPPPEPLLISNHRQGLS